VRVDLYLKNTGLAPRRSVAKDACDAGLVLVNNKPVKPAAEVRVGDRLELRLGMRLAEYEVLQLAERPVQKALRDRYAKCLRSERIETEW
jgi:ribosomal 50S subunit-recycling heat shock protein